MERSNKFPLRRTSRFSGSPATRQGKLTLVTLIAIIGMMVIIGFVGNAGYVVTEKMNTQNAADSVAFSSAQWMARGMNAATATNHLLGEITALTVVIEGLGGPEADAGLEAYPPQARITDSINQNFVNLAKINGLAVYGAQAAGNVDGKFLDVVVNKFVSKKDAKHKAWATIYDSKLSLKKSTAKRLIIKSIANAGLWVPPPWGWLTAIAAYVVHIDMNLELTEIGVQYVILEGLERIVTSDVIRKLKVDLVEQKLIPAIAAHGDYLAGRSSIVGTDKRPDMDSSVVNQAIGKSMDHLAKVYHVKAAIYPAVKSFELPGVVKLAKMRLPIAPEAPPSMTGTPENKYLVAWGTEEPFESDTEDPIAKIQKKMAENRKRTEKRISDLEKEIAFLKDLFNQVQDLKERTGVDQTERKAFQDEQGKITKNISDKMEILKQRKLDLEEIKRQQKKVAEAAKELESIPNKPDNLSADVKHLALTGLKSPSGATNGGMNQAEEQYTQWVRATYPYVDAFRAPILAIFREHMEMSGAAKYYKKWTDRYTLTKSWQFRSGYRFREVQGSNKEKGEWFKEAKNKPLTMYVMVETFNPDKDPVLPKPGAKRVQKGYEVWTKDTTEGKEMAEKMLTVVGMTHCEVKPFFSPIIFPVASRFGMTTFAQALYYNSNEQTPGAEDTNGKTQAKLGWDTLNWAPDTTVPEWGNELTVSKSKWPWELFTSSTDWTGNAKVKLNWQAKLMPVRKSRLKPAAVAAGLESTDMAANIGITFLPIFPFDRMVTH
jgi:TolA-binding protein